MDASKTQLSKEDFVEKIKNIKVQGSIDPLEHGKLMGLKTKEVFVEDSEYDNYISALLFLIKEGHIKIVDGKLCFE